MVVVAITDFSRLDLDGHIAAYTRLERRYPDGQLSIQVRIPGAPAAEVRRCAQGLQSLGLPLFVNGQPDVARELGTGLHLGSRRGSLADARAIVGPEARISVACHDEAEAVAARVEGASFVVVSPIFDVPGKGPPLGLIGLRRLVEVAGALPVVALGGIDEASWPAVRDAGAVGFAAIRAFLIDPG